MLCKKCGKEIEEGLELCDECANAEQVEEQVEVVEEETEEQVEVVEGEVKPTPVKKTVHKIAVILAIAVIVLSVIGTLLIPGIKMLIGFLAMLLTVPYNILCFVLVVGSLICGIIALIKKQGALGLILAIVSIILWVVLGVIGFVVQIVVGVLLYLIISIFLFLSGTSDW